MNLLDLVIVGGGPAGASAGRAAGIREITTVILEKEIFPRYKACGGALSERGLSYLDFPLPDSLREREIFGGRIHYHEKVTESYKPYRIATLVTRSAFDHYLLEKAADSGAEVRTGEKVINFIEKEDYVEVRTPNTTYRSKFLILSNGYQNNLGCRIRGTEPRDRYAICIVAEIQDEDCRIEQRLPGIVDIHYGLSPWGYGWIFPHKGYYSVGIGGLAEYLSNPRELFNNFLLSNNFTESYRFHGQKIPAGGYSRTIAGKRTLLTGDAAGFVDPFIGEGIAYAIRSGQLAAAVVGDRLSGKCSTLDEYNLRCNHDFGANLRNSLSLFHYMHRFPDLFFGIFSKHPEILDTYLEILGSRLTYQEFTSWLIPRIPRYLLQS
jgi:geranylgeranyl reductase family protein